MDEKQRKLAEELLFTGKQKPSFAKMLYFGIFDSSRVFPYPIPSLEEQREVEEYVEKVKRFAGTIDPDQIDRESQIPDEVIREMGNLGLLGLTIPKEYGGLGMSQYAYCKAMETLARRCGSSALFVNAHQSVGLKAILLFGTEKQKKQWLRPLASGEQIAAFSLTEQNAGSDAAGIETTAQYIPEKKAFRLKGRKQWTTNGSIAKVLTVMAKTAPEEITAFLVTPEMKGFRILDKALEKVGMRGTWTSNLAFDNVEVPEENILGPKGKGLKVCLTVLDYGRTTFGATCTGAAKELMERAIKYAHIRHQFGRPLASFPLVKKKLTYIASLTYAMEATTYLTAGLLDRGVEDIMLESAILKVFTSEALWKIVYETMQIYGGRSFFTDEPLERMMRDARLNMIGEGANEVLRAFIGAVGMRDVGMQLKGGFTALQSPIFHFGDAYRFAKRMVGYLHAPKLPIRSPEAVALGELVRRFGQSVLRTLVKYREEVVEKQLDLDRIADAAIAIYTTTAVLGKWNATPQPSHEEVAIARFYCHTTMEMAERRLHSLFSRRDQAIEAVADGLT